VTVSAVAPPRPKAAVFRTSNTDVQSFAFSSTNSWVPVDTQPATFSPGKFVVGLALSGSGALLRTSASDIQVFMINPDLTLTVDTNVATLSAPALFGSNLNNAQSSTAASVKIFAAGTRAIRAHDSWIEIYDITAAAVPKLGAPSDGLSSSGAAITVNAAGTQAVRTYSDGIEVYSLVPQTNPARVASFTTVALSSTGVGGLYQRQ
jgi:hypothetical protein